RAPGRRRSYRRHDDRIAGPKIALDLHPSPSSVEQAQLHGDQLALSGGTDDLDGEPAAGLADERGYRDAEGAVHAVGGDVHSDRGLVEPAGFARVVEVDERRDRRGGRLTSLLSLSDSSESGDASF